MHRLLLNRSLAHLTHILSTQLLGRKIVLKKLLSIIGVIVALIVWAISGQIGREVGKAAFSPSELSQQEIEAKLIEGLEEAARQINQSTPTMIDEDTRMDKVTVGPGVRVTYHYTFPRYSSRDVDTDWLRQNLHPVVMKNVCNNKDMKLSIQYGATYAYSYSGNDGLRISSFTIDRNDCGFRKIEP